MMNFAKFGVQFLINIVIDEIPHKQLFCVEYCFEKHPSILNRTAEKSRSGLKSNQNDSRIEVIEISSDDEDNSNTSVHSNEMFN